MDTLAVQVVPGSVSTILEQRCPRHQPTNHRGTIGATDTRGRKAVHGPIGQEGCSLFCFIPFAHSTLLQRQFIPTLSLHYLLSPHTMSIVWITARLISCSRFSGR